MEQDITFLLGFIAIVCMITGGTMLCILASRAIDSFVEWKASRNRAYLRRLPTRLAHLNR